MSKRTGLSVIFVGVAALILAGVIVFGGVTLSRQGQSKMPSDGYMLGISQEDETASVYLQSFGEGTMISRKFPSNYAYAVKRKRTHQKSVASGKPASVPYSLENAFRLLLHLTQAIHTFYGCTPEPNLQSWKHMVMPL